MFSDTHFHFKMMVTERGIDGVEVLSKMADRDCFLGLDIGTKPEDLLKRMQQEYESKSPEEREYPISITVISDARVFEPLKAAEAALQSGLKVGFGFTY